ncbi:MAG TPA: lysophospholipid acyltransferase family protein [Burkholderiales bacterium]|nr:lysophospholipid acyltransferase family protein [Burkholderiales bacterium]
MLWLRSALYTLLQFVITPLFSVLALLTFPFPPLTRYRIITQWTTLALWLARTICGIRYRVLGAEGVPRSPSIVLSKHQSAWETMAFQRIFPPQVWVLKKELLRIPFIGWGLAMTSPIAIDRDAGRRALKQTLEQGRDRIAKGFWVVIFPEGTRVEPGTRGKYQIGGAWLAVHTGVPVVPVAHNAGEFWPKNALLKRPGTITVSIGEPIDPAGLSAQELNARVEAWIEGEMERISGVRNEA